MKIKRTILIVLTIIWMAVVFYFSHQPAIESAKTSGKTAKVIINTLPSTKKLDTKAKEKLAEDIDTPIRKMAHFTIYTIGGIIIYLLIKTLKVKNKELLSITCGGIYAISDEIHQIFIEGRACMWQDVLIDTFGILAGIGIIIILKKITKQK